MTSHTITIFSKGFELENFFGKCLNIVEDICAKIYWSANNADS